MDPMQVALRGAIEPRLPRSTFGRLARRLGFALLADLGWLRLVVRLLAVASALGLPTLARRLGLLRLLGLAQAAAFLPTRVETRFVVPRGELYPAVEGDGARVSLFAGCVMSTALAQIDRATIRVLQRAGCAVENCAGQGCCGALHAHGGALGSAKELFRRNIAAFERDGGGPIVVNAAGCGAMLRDYGHHLRDDAAWADRAKTFAARVVDVSAFLATRQLPLRERGRQVVTYQDACHLAHAQRITAQPRALLRAIPDLELREMRESALCCGSAGVYNLTNPRESGQLQRRKVTNALATGAETIVTGNPGCLLQLRAGLTELGSTVQVKHLVELLDEASAP
jgi:glycolate oxidase iron-sulfur subunit